jgi:putative ABC transport system permease protein
MRWFRKWSGKLSQDDNFDREIAYHLDALTDANLARGMTPQQARRQAILEFGGKEQIRQQVRDVYASAWSDAMRSNGRAAVRFIRRHPSFAVTVILTLALGIGANSAVFSAIDAIVLRPLGFPHGDELVEIHQKDLQGRSPETLVAPVRLEDWNRLNSTFQTISGYYTEDVSYTSGELPEKVTEAMVAPHFLQLWGVSPAMGRDFSGEELRFGGPHAAFISDRFWRIHLHADPQAIGKSLLLDSYSYTIVGVLPASFRFPDRSVDIWLPNPMDAPFGQSRESTWFITVGRLKPGVTLAQANADLMAVQSQLGKQFPKSDGELTVGLEPLKSVVLGGIQNSLWLLYGSVSLLLFIACTNIAALLIAQTTEREHEIAIRYSLGASRAAIVGQLLTEVFVLAISGSLLGLVVGGTASHLFAVFGRDLPRVDEITLNWRILAYSLGCAFAATLVCGLFPAVRGTRRDLSVSLAQSSRTQVSTRHPWQWILVGVQVSLAVAMLIGSGLLLRSFQALGRSQLGFDPEHVLTLRISGSWGETADMGKLTQRVDRTLDGIRSVPGVEGAATSATIPGNAVSYPMDLSISEGPRNPNSKIRADSRIVSTGYFWTLGIPLLQGEACPRGIPNTAVVNRAFANAYFLNTPTVGHHLSNVARNDLIKPVEIRGIVGDAREEGIDSPPGPTVYWCYSAPTPDPEYLIRTHGDPAAMADTLRRKIHELEPGRSVFNVMPLEAHLNDRSAENRFRTMLLSLFALTAVALVSLGIYGTISYMGRLRRREVGLRLALGALPSQIVARFLFQGVRVALLGSVAGVIFGIGMSRLLKGMLYGVTNLDVVTYSAVVSLILAVAALASLAPAIRAARVDPTDVLREE